MHEIHVAPLLGLREPFCALSHLFGAIVFALLAPRLVKSGDGGRLTSTGLWVLAVTTVQTLAVSSLYHASWPGPVRDVLLRADVAVIFCMIAGSITPVHFILFRGVWRWLPVALSWTVAILGVGFQMASPAGANSGWGTPVFLAFGWGSLISAIKVWRRFGWRVVQGPVLAGMCYTLGAMVLMSRWPTVLPGAIGPHELWHVAVLCALAQQWAFAFELTSRLRAAREEDGPVILQMVPPAATAGIERRRAA